MLFGNDYDISILRILEVNDFNKKRVIAFFKELPKVLIDDINTTIQNRYYDYVFNTFKVNDEVSYSYNIDEDSLCITKFLNSQGQMTIVLRKYNDNLIIGENDIFGSIYLYRGDMVMENRYLVKKTLFGLKATNGEKSVYLKKKIDEINNLDDSYKKKKIKKKKI